MPYGEIEDIAGSLIDDGCLIGQGVRHSEDFDHDQRGEDIGEFETQGDGAAFASYDR